MYLLLYKTLSVARIAENILSNENKFTKLNLKLLLTLNDTSFNFAVIEKNALTRFSRNILNIAVQRIGKCSLIQSIKKSKIFYTHPKPGSLA